MTTVGIVGGGQLARMTHQAAIALGVRTAVLCEEPDAPAVAAGARHVAGRPDRLADLLTLAEQVDVVTLDHERTPPALLERLAAEGHRVAPGASAARLGRDKALARRVLAGHGVAAAPWTCTDDPEVVAAFGREHGWPLIVKAPTGGYDGRGVWRAEALAEVRRLIARHGRPLLVEPALAFSHELSVLVVRTEVAGRAQVVAYPPVETIQRDGQCVEVLAPAGVAPALAAAARSLAVTVAEAAELVGTMAVELFVVDGRLLLNELAVRPHNSGHLTIEACATSQFENHLRAVLGLPLGSTELRVGGASMRNVLGLADGSDPFAAVHEALLVPGVNLHRYGKVARPGRKVGHLTAAAPSLAEARSLTARALAALVGSTEEVAA